MPTCKNDCKRYYRGDEPSPKGLGYCAHAEKINQRRKGRDGKFWVVKAIKLKSGKRIRRWTRVKKAMTKKRKIKGGMLALARLKRKLKPNEERQKELRRIAELSFKSEEKGLTEQELKTLKYLNKINKTNGEYDHRNITSRVNQKTVDQIKLDLHENEYQNVDYNTLNPQTK